MTVPCVVMSHLCEVARSACEHLILNSRHTGAETQIHIWGLVEVREEEKGEGRERKRKRRRDEEQGGRRRGRAKG